jgi:single-strand DNA-binding protein
MNTAIISGRLTRDPEVKTTQSNVEVCSFTVAVDRRFKNSAGEREADFISCVAWRQTAEFIGKYFQKGSRIEVVGPIQTRNYDDKDGKRVYVTELNVEQAFFGDSKNQSSGSDYAQPAIEVAQTEKQEVAPSFDPPADLPFDL